MAPRFRFKSQPSVANLDPILTINSTPKHPVYRYTGRTATTNIWYPDGYGKPLTITGAGVDPVAGIYTPFRGPQDWAVNFNRTDQYESPNTYYANVTTEDVVWEFIAYYHEQHATYYRYYIYKLDATVGYMIYQAPASMSLYAGLFDGAPAYKLLVSSMPSGWAHFFIVYKFGNNIKCYVNGKPNPTVSVSDVTTLTATTGLFKIGTSCQAPIAYASMWAGSGWIDDVQQDALAASRFNDLMGVTPYRADGTATPVENFRNSAAWIHNVTRDGMPYTQKVGNDWPTIGAYRDEGGETITGLEQLQASENKCLQSSTPGTSPFTVSGTCAGASNTTDVTSPSLWSYTASKVTGVGTSANGLSQTIGVVSPGNKVAVGFWIYRISTDKVLTLENSQGAAYGKWIIDMVDLPAYWVRLTHNSPYVQVINPFLEHPTDGFGFALYQENYSADASFYLWNFQVEYEVGLEVTGDIGPTTTAAVTRAQQTLTYLMDDGNIGTSGSLQRGTIESNIYCPSIRRSTTPSVANLKAGITINGSTVYPTYRYKLGDATSTQLTAWDYGETLGIADTGVLPVFKNGSPLLGTDDNSAYFAGGQVYQAAGNAFADIALEDFMIEGVIKGNTDGWGFAKYNGTNGIFAGFSSVLQPNRFLVKFDGGASPGKEAWAYNSSITVANNDWIYFSIFYDASETSASNGICIAVNGNISTSFLPTYDNAPATIGTLTVATPFTIGSLSTFSSKFTGNIAYLAMALKSTWFVGGAANLTEWAAVHKERFYRMCGLYPQLAEGTKAPTSYSRSTAGFNRKTAYLEDLPADLDPYLWLTFDETSGSDVSDSSGNGRDQTLTGAAGAFWVDGVYDNAGYFDAGVPNYISLPITYFNNLNGCWACWIKKNWTTANNANTRMMCSDDTGGNFFVFRTGILVNDLVWSTPNGITYYNVSAGDLRSYDNQWVHIAFTWEDIAGTTTVKGYANGVNNVTGNKTFAGPISSPDTAIYFGRFVFVAGNLTATIDDFTLFQKTLSADEVSALYRSTIHNTSYTKTTCYRLGEGWPRVERLLTANSEFIVGQQIEAASPNYALYSDLPSSWATLSNIGVTSAARNGPLKGVPFFVIKESNDGAGPAVSHVAYHSDNTAIAANGKICLFYAIIGAQAGRTYSYWRVRDGSVQQIMGFINHTTHAFEDVGAEVIDTGAIPYGVHNGVEFYLYWVKYLGAGDDVTKRVYFWTSDNAKSLTYIGDGSICFYLSHVQLEIMDSTTGAYLWLKFDETSGATVSDSSGAARDQTLVGSSTNFWKPGRSGNCGYFDAAIPNYVTLPAAYFDGQKGTFSCWVKRRWDNTSNTRLLGTQHSSGALYENRTHIASGGLTLYYTPSAGAVAVGSTFGDMSAYHDIWVHVAWTWAYGGANTLIRGYLNGANVALSNMTLVGDYISEPNDALYIGKWSTSYFTGYVDDFCFWQRTLTDEELLLLYEEGALKYKGKYSSPIITTTATVTRSADELYYNGDNLSTINDKQEGIIRLLVLQREQTPGAIETLYKANDGGSSADEIEITCDTNGYVNASITATGGTACTLTGPSVNICDREPHEIRLAFSGGWGTAVIEVDGTRGTEASLVPADVPGDLDRIYYTAELIADHQVLPYDSEAYFRLDVESYPPSVGNLSPLITINSTTVAPTFRYKLGDATVAQLTAWDYGETLGIASTGTLPTPNAGSPLLGTVDDSVYFPAGQIYQAAGAAFADVTTEDLYFEILFKTPTTMGLQRIFSKNQAATTNGYQLSLVGSSGAFSFQCFGAVAYITTSLSVNLEANTWYFVSCFWDGSETTNVNGIAVYANNIPPSAGAGDPSTVASLTSTAKLTLAARAYDFGNKCPCNIAYLAMAKQNAWYAGGAQNPIDWAAVHKERFYTMCGLYPQLAEGTKAPTSYSRASTAFLEKYNGSTTTYYRVGSGWPRTSQIIDDNGNTSAGQVSEQVSKNVTQYSEAMDSNTAFNATIDADNVGQAAPVTGKYFDGIIGDGVDTVHYVRSALIGVATTTTYVFSTFLKKGNQNWARLQLWQTSLGTVYGYFDLNNGVIGSSFSGCTGGIIDYGNGIYRCYIVPTSNLYAEGGYSYVYSAEGDNDASFAGDTVTVNTWVFGLQVEPGSYPSDYVGPTTTGAIVTRTNYTGYSLDASSWGATNITYGTGISNILQGYTAAAIVESNDAGAPTGHSFASPVVTHVATEGQTVFLSMILAAGDRPWIRVNAQLGTVYFFVTYFNITTEAFSTTSGTLYDSGVESIGTFGGKEFKYVWMRLLSEQSTGNSRVLLYPCDNTPSVNYAGTGLTCFYLAMTQMEFGMKGPTTPLVTTTAAVSSAPDIVYWLASDGNIGGTGSDRQAVIRLRTVPKAFTPLGPGLMYRINDGGDANAQIDLYHDASGYVHGHFRAPGGTSRRIVGPSVSIFDNKPHYVTLEYRVGSALIMVDGSAGTENTDLVLLDIPDDLDRIYPSTELLADHKLLPYHIPERCALSISQADSTVNSITAQIPGYRETFRHGHTARDALRYSVNSETSGYRETPGAKNVADDDKHQSRVWWRNRYFHQTTDTGGKDSGDTSTTPPTGLSLLSLTGDPKSRFPSNALINDVRIWDHALDGRAGSGQRAATNEFSLASTATVNEVITSMEYSGGGSRFKMIVGEGVSASDDCYVLLNGNTVYI